MRGAHEMHRAERTKCIERSARSTLGTRAMPSGHVCSCLRVRIVTRGCMHIAIRGAHATPRGVCTQRRRAHAQHIGGARA